MSSLNLQLVQMVLRVSLFLGQESQVHQSHLCWLMEEGEDRKMTRRKRRFKKRLTLSPLLETVKTSSFSLLQILEVHFELGAISAHNLPVEEEGPVIMKHWLKCRYGIAPSIIKYFGTRRGPSNIEVMHN